MKRKLVRIGATLMRLKQTDTTITAAPGGRVTASKSPYAHEAIFAAILDAMEASWKMATQATLHCLTGCAIGEVLGMVIGSAIGLHNVAMDILSILLAFLFGYSFTLIPLIRSGFSFGKATSTALASDTVSIASMEIVDNLIVVVIPGALTAGLATFLFWGSLAASLAVAFVVTVPVNRWLIARGKGHALIHELHHRSSHERHH